MENIDIKLVDSEKEYLKCLDIRKKVFVEEQKISKDLEIDEFEDISTHFLVYVGKRAVATGRFRVVNNFLKFERMAVLKNFRKMKLGSKLLKHMEKVGFEKFSKYLQITHAQETAVSFYKKNGWTVIGKKILKADITHYMMINFIKDKKYIKNLKCLKDPNLDKNIKNFLLKFI